MKKWWCKRQKGRLSPLFKRQGYVPSTTLLPSLSRSVLVRYSWPEIPHSFMAHLLLTQSLDASIAVFDRPNQAETIKTKNNLTGHTQLVNEKVLRFFPVPYQVRKCKPRVRSSTGLSLEVSMVYAGEITMHIFVPNKNIWP